MDLNITNGGLILFALYRVLPFFKGCACGLFLLLSLMVLPSLIRNPLEEKTPGADPEPVYQPPAVPPVFPEDPEGNKENQDPEAP